MLKVLVDITEEMQDARACCGEDSDCNECPCHIGTDDCVYNYESGIMEKFPIQYQNKGEFIPLGLMLEHEEQCLKNHHQSVQQLAKRGGTSYVETYYILNNSEYKKPINKELDELGRYEENARKIVFAKAYEYLMNNDLGG